MSCRVPHIPEGSGMTPHSQESPRLFIGPHGIAKFSPRLLLSPLVSHLGKLRLQGVAVNPGATGRGRPWPTHLLLYPVRTVLRSLRF